MEPGLYMSSKFRLETLKKKNYCALCAGSGGVFKNLFSLPAALRRGQMGSNRLRCRYSNLCTGKWTLGTSERDMRIWRGHDLRMLHFCKARQQGSEWYCLKMFSPEENMKVRFLLDFVNLERSKNDSILSAGPVYVLCVILGSCNVKGIRFILCHLNTFLSQNIFYLFFIFLSVKYPSTAED